MNTNADPYWINRLDVKQLLALEADSDCLAATPSDMQPLLLQHIASQPVFADKQDVSALIVQMVDIGRPAIPLLEEIAAKEANPRIKGLVAECLQKIHAQR